MLSRLAGPEPLRVLDVGCGTGFLALLLAELGHYSNGIDLAAEMVERAKAKAQQSDVHAYFREGGRRSAGLSGQQLRPGSGPPPHLDATGS